MLVVFISMTLSLSLGKSAAFAVCDLLKGGGAEAEAAAPDLRLVRPKVCQQFQFSVFKMSSRVTCGKVASSKQRNVALSCASLAAAMCVQQLPPLGRALAANYDARTRVIHLQLQRHR